MALKSIDDIILDQVHRTKELSPEAFHLFGINVIMAAYTQAVDLTLDTVYGGGDTIIKKELRQNILKQLIYSK